MAELTPGTVLGDRFEISGVLGQGGMATVYLAQDRLRDEPVALKVMHEHLANTRSMRDRLRREVIAAGRIRHPHALVAADLHELEGRLALSMPLHRGHTLAERVEAGGPLSAEALERLCAELAGALAEAHRCGVVHRDVTPSNVMIDVLDHGMLTDFGMARLEDLRTATATGVVGTCGYAAPEVYQGVRADPRSDVYSLGAVLYLAATGKAPFDAANPMGVLKRQLEEDHVPLSSLRPDLPAHLTVTIEGMLRRDPAARPQGARVLVEALEAREVPAQDVPVPPQAETGAIEIAPAAPPAGHPLPEGTWTVVVRRRDELFGQWEQARRAQRRLIRERRRRRGRIASQVEELMDELRITVRDALGVEKQATPWDELAGAVALEAGLPRDALIVAPAMYKRRFRLVDGVDAATAQRLTDAALEAGFQAERVEGGATEERGGLAELPGAFFKAALAMGSPLVIAMVLGVALPSFLAPLLGMLGLLSVMRRVLTSERVVLPLAYPRNPRLYLAAGHADLLPPSIDAARASAAQAYPLPARGQATGTSTPAGDASGRETTAVQGGLREAHGPSAQTAAAAAGPADRVGQMVHRTETQLRALEAALSDDAGALPAVVTSNLRITVIDLRDQAAALGREARRIQLELERQDDAAISAAANRIEGRLKRLRTLQRAGDPVDAQEIEDLERGLEVHRQTQEGIEALEGRQTQMLARLLEIGAAAAQARRELARDPAAGRSSPRLLEQLRREVVAAAGALEEVERSARAAGRGSGTAGGALGEERGMVEWEGGGLSAIQVSSGQRT